MVFQTQYNHTSSKPEINSGKTLVERAGYISAQKRIENMILAGHRLIEFRKSQFDFEDEKVDPSFMDPTRSPNFDMADAFQMNQAVHENLYKSKLDREAVLKASQTAQEALKGHTEQEKEV